MKHLVSALITVGALAAVGSVAVIGLSGNRPLTVAIAGPQPFDVPDTAAEWRGRIDYPKLDREIRQMMQRPEMAGLAVAIVEEGELRFVGTYGTTDRSTGAPVTAATVFRWASLSKTATGMLAAHLASKGELDLNSRLSSWRTSLRLPGGAETHLTVAQLLAQQSGLTKNAYDERLEDGQNPAAIRASLNTAPLQCDPGTCHTYQNVAFDAASEILGQAAGTGFVTAVRDQLFRPLGMASAGYGMDQLTGARDWARPHRNLEVRPLKEAYWRVPAAAGAESNIVDLATWMQAAMGLYPDTISTATRDLALQPRVATERPYSGELAAALSNARYGLGWRVMDYRGGQLVGHSGAVAGYRATMIFEPATRTGVVAMWNSDWGRPFRIPFAVLDSYHRRSDSRWLDLSDIPPADVPARGPS